MTVVPVRVDRALGRIPSYAVAALSLEALAVISVVLAIPGWVPYSPAAIIVSFVVAIAASWIGSKVMGAILRAPTYTLSAVVTGLLLGFLFQPTLSPTGLLALVGAAFVASASKFLIVRGGRHLLNPAAFGAFVVGLTGLAGAGWWVATPALLPFVVIGGLVIAIRTRLIETVLVFAVLAVLAGVLGFIHYGADAGTALTTVIGSTPVLFLGAYMLTEPVTLPSRRRNRLIVATVVALLTAVPYFVDLHLATFTFSPELALLLGNVLAMLLERPRAATMRFAGRRALTGSSTEFSFTPERVLPHGAGQYLELQLPHRGADVRGIRRTLTIVSRPDAAEVQVALRMRDPLSSFKQALDALPVGAPVRAVTVGGAFTLPADRSVPLLLVASGIGITPFISQLRDDAAAVAAGATARDILLVNRIASADDIAYADVLESTGVRVLLICPDPAAFADVRLPDHWHVADRLDGATLRGVLPDPAGRTAYVSGSPRFVESTRRLLRATGVRRIRTDAFSGY